MWSLPFRLTGLSVLIFGIAGCRNTASLPPRSAAVPTPFSVESYEREMMEKARRGPKPQLRVLEARRIAASPLEVFQGYDTALDLRLGFEGEAPSWWGRTSLGVLTARGSLVDGAGKTVNATVRCKTPESVPQSSEERAQKRPGEYRARYVMRLKGRSGPLALKDQLPVFYGTTPIPQAQVPVNSVVLADGETARVPQPDRTPGVEIKALEVRKSGRDGETQLRVNSRLLGRGRTFGVKVKLLDARGKQWNIKPRFIPNFEEIEDQTFALDLTSIPRSAGRIVAQGWVENGDSWPASFAVELRDGKGNLVESSRKEKRSGRTWKLRSSRLIPNPAAKANAQMQSVTHTHTLTLVFERLPGGDDVTSRGWSVGVTQSGEKLAGAILGSQGKKEFIRFEQFGIERKPPVMEYWINLVLPANLDKKAVLKMNIHPDDEPEREFAIPLVATKVLE